MKKILFFAAAAVAVMTSCSSSDDFVAEQTPVNPANQEVAEGRVAIKFGADNGIITSVRGTGTVGTTNAATNKWAAQHFNVYMTQKDNSGNETTNLALIGGATGNPIYNNTEFWAPGMDENDANHGGTLAGITTIPTDSFGTARPVNDSVRYYPATGNFDFYAYRLDSCGTAAPTITASNITVPFEITGSEDIMVANAVPSNDTLTYYDVAANRAYSSFAARKGLQPTLLFKHLLTRLTFTAIPGTDEATKGTAGNGSGIVIDSIKVISDTEGTLTIAPAANQGIAWTANTEDSLVLKQRYYAPAANDPTDACADSVGLVKLVPVDLRGKISKQADAVNYDKINVGEALLVKPSASYRFIIFLSQDLPVLYSNPLVYDHYKYEIATNLTRTNDGSTTTDEFEAGKSYNVQIQVNGVQEIIVKAALEHWVEETTPIIRDPENDESYN